MYIFGYGSLINLPSVSNALKRTLNKSDLLPVVLDGYVRSWRGKETLLFETLGRTATGAFLDLKSEAKSYVNGVLVTVNEKELEQLKLREKNYDCIEVTDSIRGAASAGPVFTFVAKSDHLVREIDSDIYIPQLYIDMVIEGCRAMGEEFLREYEKTTEPLSLAVLDGPYSFIDEAQARYI